MQLDPEQIMAVKNAKLQAMASLYDKIREHEHDAEQRTMNWLDKAQEWRREQQS